MRQLFGYADDTKKNTADIKALQAEREAANIILRQIISDADADRRITERDRENLLLRLEVALLKNDNRALPPGASAAQSENADISGRLEALEKRMKRLEQKAGE